MLPVILVRTALYGGGVGSKVSLCDPETKQAGLEHLATLLLPHVLGLLM